jgi:hypothetical protein
VRPTITLDDDVASRLARLNVTRPIDEVANEVLRAGLDQIEAQSSTARYTIVPVSGKALRTDLDNTFDVIADIEGDDYK